LAELNPISLEWEGPAASMTVSPGEGVFVNVQAPTQVTFVGEVMSGQLSNPIPKGFNIRASQVPQAGKVSTELLYPPNDGDQLYKFNSTDQKYFLYGFTTLLGWDPSEPTIEVGEAFFVNNPNTAKNWTRTFDITK